MERGEKVHWADVIAEDLIKTGRRPVVATGISPSGPIHIGNLREVITADAIYRALHDRGADDARLIYIADTYDPLRRLYPFLPDSYEEHVGRPLSAIPDPEGCCESYAAHFLQPFLESLDELEIDIEVYRADLMYANGDYDEAIVKALRMRDRIALIIDEVTGKVTSHDWSPFNPICKSCGRLTTTIVTGFDTDRMIVSYRCRCGDENEVPVRGGGKLTWRVDWPARWAILGVTAEPFGKDHASAGSSYESGIKLSREIYDYDPPYPIPFEHVLLKGKGSMSSSKGVTITISEMLSCIPPEILKYIMIRVKPEKHIEIDPGLGLLNLIDEYERLDIGSVRSKKLSATKKSLMIDVPFRHIVNIVQIAEFDAEKTLEIIKRGGYRVDDLETVRRYVEYAKEWLERFAPQSVRFEVRQEIPREVDEIPPEVREGLVELADFLMHEGIDAEMVHQEVYAIAERIGVKPKEIFKGIYLSLLGRKSGPRAGWFLTSLDRDFVVRRFEGVER
ncbi:MAG: lysine--tRNA ligase [Candidatus Syntropharchaeales archaeon]